MRKFLFALVALCVVAAIGFYIASPYVAFYELQHAAKTGGRDAIEAAVDFPAVRDDLKAQLNGAFQAKMQADGNATKNPLDAIGMLLAPAVIGRVIDAYVTPQNIAQMLAKAHTPKKGASPSDGEKTPVVTHYAYLSLDRFRATVSEGADKDQSLGFVMERRGLFDWKLIRIELPLDALK
jgi:Protein of unknown function (DUF2939)